MTDPYSMSMFGMGPAANAASDDPEAFQLLQNERNRQMLANLMLSRGMQQPQGQMVGRFYVPPSPLQHAGGLAAAGLGAYMMGQQGEGLSGLAEKRNAARAQAIQKYMGATSGEQIPERTLPEGVAGPVNDAQFIPPDPNKAKAAVLEALTNNDPRVRESVKFLEQQRAMQEDKATQRDLLKSEKEMDRELKREGIEANVSTRLEQMKNTAALTAMQIDARDRAGQDANELKKTLADQMAEIKKMEMESRERMAREANETRKTIAGMKGTGGVPGGEKLSATAQKELIQTDEQIQGGQAALSALDEALKVNDSAMGFTGAGAVASAGSLLPESIRPKAVDATVNLDNIVMGSALPQLKDIFGGMPTEGERKILLEMQGSSSKTPAQRKDIFERARKAVERRLEFNTQKSGQLRSGTYFKPQGSMPAPSAGGLTPAEQQELDQLRKRFGK